MLQPPDAEIVKRDAILPGLATMLDPEALAEAIQPHFPESLSDIRLMYIRYKPEKSCLASYRILADGSPLTFYARAHPAEAYDNIQPSEGRIALKENGVMVYLFPHDKILRILRGLNDVVRRKKILRKLMPGHPDLWESEMNVLRYLPERRFVGELKSPKGSRGAVKVYNHEEYGCAKSNGVKFHSGRALRFAERLGQSDKHRMISYAWLSGNLLSDALLSSDFDATRLALVGHALAEFHQQAPSELKVLNREAEIHTLSALAAHVAFICPHLAERMNEFSRKASESLLNLPATFRPIHGDFYAKQVLITEEAIGIIDLDRAVLGNPASDLGNFIAHLDHKAICGALSFGSVEPLSEALLQGYLEICPFTSRVEVELYRSIGLFRLTPDPFRYRESGWPVLTEAILARAEKSLASTHVHRSDFSVASDREKTS